MQDSFKVKLDLTYKEAVLTLLFTMARMKLIRGLGAFMLIMIVLTSILTGVTGILLNLAGVLIAISLLFIVMLIILFFIWRRNNSAYRGLEYQFNHWGITLTKGGTFSSPWRHVLQVKETQQFFVFFVRNGMHFVQKRMFGNEAECMAFREFVRERMQ